MATKQKEIKRLNLPIEGMTCASCVFHVEGALNGVAGVTNATVNLATEKAVVEIEGPDVPVERLVEAVSQAGYKIPHATMTLNIGGMTCASCVFHVESALAKVDGVSEATVNLATEKATVKYVAGATGQEDFTAAVADAGYRVEGIDIGLRDGREELDRLAKVKEIRALKNRVDLAATGAILLFLGTFGGFPWVDGFMSRSYYPFLLWAVATPVQFWAGWTFYSSGLPTLRHGTANMHTLIALGTSVAYTYSVVVILLDAISPQVLVDNQIATDVYFDTAAIIVALILVGRFLEARAMGRP